MALGLRICEFFCGMWKLWMARCGNVIRAVLAKISMRSCSSTCITRLPSRIATIATKSSSRPFSTPIHLALGNILPPSASDPSSSFTEN